jgi:hypothetical protein
MQFNKTTKLLIFLSLLIFGSCSSEIQVKPLLTKVYKADFYNASNELVQSDSLVYKEYDEDFLLVQKKITWDVFRTTQVNSNTQTLEHQTETSGVVYSKQEVWLHPPRFKAYVDFTEFSAFPRVKLPLKDSLQYKAKLDLGTYASKENGKEVLSTYELVKADSNYIVKTKSTSLKGIFYSEFIYNEIAGFIRFHYTNPKGEKLIIWDDGLLDDGEVFFAVPEQVTKISDGFIEAECKDEKIAISTCKKMVQFINHKYLLDLLVKGLIN